MNTGKPSTPFRTLIRVASSSVLLLLWPACGTETGTLPPTDGGADAYSAPPVPPDGASTVSGGSAGDGGLTSSVFTGNGGACLTLGAVCGGSSDCCSGTCAGQVCAYPTCTADTGACSANGDCCSQNCTGGTCAPLNTTCSTLGNPCASSSTCCSGFCSNGYCQASSFCGQPGDACAASGDCCNGSCDLSAGNALGTCAASPPRGPANCGLTDGSLCQGGTVVDGGVPLCGGSCCSRACAPWGPTGVFVCQPASGCHVVGDLCTTDSDCCGSVGLPGGSGKPATCVITAPSTVGVCRLPMGCKPDGDVCKLQTMSCNASCDCCSGNCETEDTCKQDNVGVPRCAGACVGAGQVCASSANCCGGLPCVPNGSDAGPPFVCADSMCVGSCGACTTSADCCPGTSCSLPAGGSRGICGPCGGTTAKDGGAPGDGGESSGGTDGSTGGSPGGPDAGGVCALFGQLCQSDSDCCNTLGCIGGRCGVSIIPR
jgi:hypothetical protein